MKVLINGVVAALLAIWALPPVLFGGLNLPATYAWTLALLFVAADMSYVSLKLARVQARRRPRTS